MLTEHKEEIRERFRVEEIGIFGSYVRVEEKTESDLNILVGFEEPVSLLGIVRLENYLSELLSIKVDLVPKKDGGLYDLHKRATVWLDNNRIIFTILSICRVC